MHNKEKNLIENLFKRLKKTEINSPSRDESASTLIQKLVQEQPFSSYYMIQTILIQETAIKKMNEKIEELEKKILYLESSDNKKTSFLSGVFPKNTSSQSALNSKSTWQNNPNQNSYGSSNASVPPINNTGGFLSNALQTATGVAGGMILGNMLMNLFHQTKPEEEIFNTIHSSSNDNTFNENFFNDPNDNDFINESSNINSLDDDNIDNHIDNNMDYNIDSDHGDIDDLDDNFI